MFRTNDESLRPGDREAFEAAYFFYYPELIEYVKKRLGSTEAAEDIVQQAFLKLAQQTVCIHSVRYFLFRLVAGAAIDWLRSWNRRNTITCENFDSYPGDTLTGDEIVAQQERLQAVVTAIEKLSPVEKAALQATYFDGLNSKETAQALGISPDAARQRISRAIEQLRLAMVQSA